MHRVDGSLSLIRQRQRVEEIWYGHMHSVRAGSYPTRGRSANAEWCDQGQRGASHWRSEASVHEIPRPVSRKASLQCHVTEFQLALILRLFLLSTLRTVLQMTPGDGATYDRGNDFLLIDNRGSTEPLMTPEQAVEVCKHNFGVGGDGVIFALPGSNGCDHTMRIFNSDGTEPEMCGNGIRCVASMGMSLSLCCSVSGRKHFLDC